MAVRLKDIARDLGVSVVTVSKVLRGRDDISKETSERILKRMRELNYQPNFAARSLATGRSFSLGLIVPSLLHPFFAEVAKGIGDEIRRKGYGLLISSSDEDPELERQEVAQLIGRQVDALVVASTQRTGTVLEDLEDSKPPLILIDRKLPGLKTHFIGLDDEEIGQVATRHLIEAGCRRIAHIRGPEISTGIGRLKGYIKALEELGREFSPEYVIDAQTADNRAEESGFLAMRHLLEKQPRPDGVFCYNDPVALGAIEAVLDSGLRVGEDVAIVGAGNSRWASMMRVPLSTVDQAASLIGQRAARLALRLIESDKPVRLQTILLPAKIVARASSVRGAAGRA